MVWCGLEEKSPHSPWIIGNSQRPGAHGLCVCPFALCPDGQTFGLIKKYKKTGYPQLRFSVGLSSFFLEQNLRCMSIPIFRKKSNGTHAYLQSSRQVVGTTYTWLVPRCHSPFLPCKSPAASLLPSSSHRLVQYWRPLEVIHKIHKDVLTY